MKRVVSDAHGGIKAAARVLPTTWPDCRAHLEGNALARAGKSARRVVAAFTATAFAHPDHAAVGMQWPLAARRVRGNRPKRAALMDGEADVLACMPFSPQHQRGARRHGTHPIERLDSEIGRRTGVVGIFPDKAAIRRLAGAILMGRGEKQAEQRRCCRALEALAPVLDVFP